jgi:hypothetical protein
MILFKNKLASLRQLAYWQKNVSGVASHWALTPAADEICVASKTCLCGTLHTHLRDITHIHACPACGFLRTTVK